MIQEQLYNNYLYGNKQRLFLNTNLGCKAQCSYCYLPKLDFSLDKIPKNTIAIDDLIDILNNNEEFRQGKDGTILSIGCYSECWDLVNREDTIDLVNKLLKYENPIQLATKEYIEEFDLTKINISKVKYYNHLSIYISSSTISEYEKYESGTINPNKRFNSFELAFKYNIPMYLYLKPVLKDITIKDIDLYIEIIKKYSIDTIVGQLFKENGNIDAPIAKGQLYYANTNQDYNIITAKFMEYCNVYKYSIEPIQEGMTNE